MNLDQRRSLVAARVRDLHRQRYALAERDFATFFRQAWKVLEPDSPLRESWHQDLIAEYLEACQARQIKRLIINMPPRYAKSTLVSIAFPSWVWLKDPGERFMSFSYSQSLSNKHSRDRRTLIESNWYQRAWGNRFSIASDQNMVTEFANTKRGHMIATSMRGTGTGKGGNILIIDDPHDTTRASSDPMRDADIREFDSKIQSRIDLEEKGVIIIVMQRLHEKDLTGHVVAKERDKWTWLKLPAEAPKRVAIRFPMSGRRIIREKGEALSPLQHDRAQLKDKRIQLGSYNYEGQFGQNPSPAKGGVIKRKWFKYWRALPARFDRMLISIDCAFKDEDDNDYVAIQAWGAKGADHYLIDQVHDLMDFVATIGAIRQFCATHSKITEKIVEEKANGAAVISSLKHEITGLIGYNPRSSKLERARAVSPLIEAGNVYLPDPTVHPWVGGVVEECAVFPKGAHDDRVDAMSQALLRFMGNDAGEFDESMIPKGSSTVVPSKGSEDQW